MDGNRKDIRDNDRKNVRDDLRNNVRNDFRNDFRNYVRNNVRNYAVPIVFTVCVHSIVLMIVGINWNGFDTEKKKPAPSYVKAKLVKLNDTVQKKKPPPKKKAETKKVQDDAAAKKKKQAEIEKKKKAAAEAKRKKEAAEKKRKAEIAKKKAAEAKQKAEAEQRKAEEARKKAAAEQERREREAAQTALAAAMAEEEAFIQAQADQQLASSYITYIREQIERKWSRPPSARNGMVLEIQLQLIPTGDVVNVSIAKSSGNAALDRSAINAVKKVGRFDRLKELPNRVFEQNFRSFKLKYTVEGMRL